MRIVRGADRPTLVREEPLPTLQHLVDREAGSHQVTVLVNQLVTGQRVPAHVHAVEEVLLVAAGRCRVRVGDETAEAGAGDAVIVPPNTVHGFEHSGSETTTVFAVLASPDVQVGTSANAAT